MGKDLITFCCIATLVLSFINYKKNQKIMAALDDLKAEVITLQESVDTMQSAIAKAIADLQAQIASGATEAQLQEIVESLKTTQLDVESTPTA